MVTAVYPEPSAEGICSDLIYMQLYLLHGDCLSASPLGNPSCPVGKGRGPLDFGTQSPRPGKGSMSKAKHRPQLGCMAPECWQDNMMSFLGPQPTYLQGSDREGDVPQPKSMSVNSTNFPTKFLKSTQ